MNQSEMIGSRLKEERLQQKLTLKQLSEKVGLSIGLPVAGRAGIRHIESERTEKAVICPWIGNECLF